MSEVETVFFKAKYQQMAKNYEISAMFDHFFHFFRPMPKNWEKMLKKALHDYMNFQKHTKTTWLHEFWKIAKNRLHDYMNFKKISDVDYITT